jgi:hypothetical protein
MSEERNYPKTYGSDSNNSSLFTQFGSAGLNNKVQDYFQYPIDLGEGENRSLMLFSIFKRKPITLNTESEESYNTIFSKIADDAVDAAKVTSASIMNFAQDLARGVTSDQTFTSRGTSISQTTRFQQATDIQREIIALYTPGKIESNTNLNYEEGEFGSRRNIQDLLGSRETRKGKILAGARKFVGARIAGGDDNTLNSLFGSITNPRKEVLFNGVAHRKFSYAYEFAPRSQEESNLVFEIIKLFRFYALPKSQVGGIFLEFPGEFEIDFLEVTEDGSIIENEYINKIGRCVLSDISINYTPNSISSFHKNGAPTQINLDLTFQEIEIITQDRVAEGY